MTRADQNIDAEQLAGLALTFHREGNFKQAERLYLQILAAEPRHFNARHSLGILRAEEGRIEDAIELIRAALKMNPDSASAWMNLGGVLSMAGRFDEALAGYDKALAINPSQVEALHNRGKTLRDLGRLEEALADYLAFLARTPNDLDALNDCSDIYLRLGRLDEALAGYDKLLAALPNNVSVLNGRGNVLRAMKRFDGALESYQRALALSPNLPETLNNRGIAFAELRRYREALANYDRALAVLPPGDAALSHRGFILNNRGKALCQLGRITEGFTDFTRSAEIVYGTSAAPAPFTGPPLAHKAAHDLEQKNYLARLGQTPPRDDRLRLQGGARLTTPAVNPAIQRHATVEQWQSAVPKIAVVDDFLTQSALSQLQRFCWDSNVWRTVFKDGYLGAFPEQGFASPLLAQIAEELRDCFPPIFQGHELRYLWAFKYDSQLSGTIVHADEAAVNVNFWITPDEANLDPQSGGLIIWDIAAPADWDFSHYNGAEKPIQEFLAKTGAKSTTVPYRANRAVIFDSNLFHATDEIKFKHGYLNRRINVTLLYGHRVDSPTMKSAG